MVSDEDRQRFIARISLAMTTGGPNCEIRTLPAEAQDELVALATLLWPVAARVDHQSRGWFAALCYVEDQDVERLLFPLLPLTPAERAEFDDLRLAMQAARDRCNRERMVFVELVGGPLDGRTIQSLASWEYRGEPIAGVTLYLHLPEDQAAVLGQRAIYDIRPDEPGKAYFRGLKPETPGG